MLKSSVLSVVKTKSGDIVFLNPNESNMAIPIFVGESEAYSILVGMGFIKEKRPLSHDAMISLRKISRISFLRLEIYSVEKGIYNAKLFYVKGKNTNSFEIRPSDGIAIAVREGLDIFVSKVILEEAGINIENIDAMNSGDLNNKSSKIRELEEQLARALRLEEYENAVRIRNSIKELIMKK